MPHRSTAIIASLLLAVGAGSMATSSQAQVPGLTASTPDAATLREAVSDAQHGDETHALGLVDSILAAHPPSAPALRLKAMLLDDLSRPEEASAAYEGALHLAPDDPDLLLKVGVNDLLRHQTDTALLLLKRRARLLPRDKEGNYYLAQAYHLQGNNDLALSTIRKAVAAAPDDPTVQQKLGELFCSAGRYADALPSLEKAAHADPALPRIHFDLAVASYDSMNLDQAAAFADAEARLQPNDLENLMLQAAIAVKLAHWEQAAASTQRVLAARPDDPQALVILGHCQLELKDYPAAIATLRRSLAVDPTQATPHYLLSRAYTATGDAVDAQHEAGLHREMMQHMAAAMPRSVAEQGAALSGQAQALLRANDEVGALHLFQSAVKGPYATAGSAWMFVGATYLSLGNTAAAERVLRHALQVDPKTHGANTYLGAMELQGGDLAGAEASFKAELALDPNQPLALGELGEVRYRQGRWAEAAELLTRSRTTAPSLLYMLCDAEFHLGRAQAADLTAETLWALSKADPDARPPLLALLEANGQDDLAKHLNVQ